MDLAWPVVCHSCGPALDTPGERTLGVQVVWSTLLDSIATGGKNGQQIISAVLKAIKTYRKLLKSFCKGTRAEAALVVHVQVSTVPFTFSHSCKPLLGNSHADCSLSNAIS